MIYRTKLNVLKTRVFSTALYACETRIIKSLIGNRYVYSPSRCRPTVRVKYPIMGTILSCFVFVLLFFGFCPVLFLFYCFLDFVLLFIIKFGPTKTMLFKVILNTSDIR